MAIPTTSVRFSACASGRRDRRLHVFQDGAQLGGISGIENVAARAFPEQAHRVVHGLVFGRAAHAGPDQELQRSVVGLADGGSDAGEFGGDGCGPFGMVSRLPAKIENAVAVFSDSSVRVDLSTDGDEYVFGRVEGAETVTPSP